MPVALLAMLLWQKQGHQAAVSQGVKPPSWKPQRKMRRPVLLMIEACSPHARNMASRMIRSKKSLRGSAELCWAPSRGSGAAGNWGDHAPAGEQCARLVRRKNA